jgi:hypothetical protein
VAVKEKKKWWMKPFILGVLYRKHLSFQRCVLAFRSWDGKKTPLANGSKTLKYTDHPKNYRRCLETTRRSRVIVTMGNVLSVLNMVPALIHAHLKLALLPACLCLPLEVLL